MTGDQIKNLKQLIGALGLRLIEYWRALKAVTKQDQQDENLFKWGDRWVKNPKRKFQDTVNTLHKAFQNAAKEAYAERCQDCLELEAILQQPSIQVGTKPATSIDIQEILRGTIPDAIAAQLAELPLGDLKELDRQVADFKNVRNFKGKVSLLVTSLTGNLPAGNLSEEEKEVLRNSELTVKLCPSMLGVVSLFQGLKSQGMGKNWKLETIHTSTCTLHDSVKQMKNIDNTLFVLGDGQAVKALSDKRYRCLTLLTAFQTKIAFPPGWAKKLRAKTQIPDGTALAFLNEPGSSASMDAEYRRTKLKEKFEVFPIKPQDSLAALHDQPENTGFLLYPFQISLAEHLRIAHIPRKINEGQPHWRVFLFGAANPKLERLHQLVIAGLIHQRFQFLNDEKVRESITEELLADRDYLGNLSAVSGLAQYKAAVNRRRARARH